MSNSLNDEPIPQINPRIQRTPEKAPKTDVKHLQNKIIENDSIDLSIQYLDEYKHIILSDDDASQSLTYTFVTDLKTKFDQNDTNAQFVHSILNFIIDLCDSKYGFADIFVSTNFHNSLFPLLYIHDHDGIYYKLLQVIVHLMSKSPIVFTLYFEEILQKLLEDLESKPSDATSLEFIQKIIGNQYFSSMDDDIMSTLWQLATSCVFPFDPSKFNVVVNAIGVMACLIDKAPHSNFEDILSNYDVFVLLSLINQDDVHSSETVLSLFSSLTCYSEIYCVKMIEDGHFYHLHEFFDSTGLTPSNEKCIIYIINIQENCIITTKPDFTVLIADDSYMQFLQACSQGKLILQNPLFEYIACILKCLSESDEALCLDFAIRIGFYEMYMERKDCGIPKLICYLLSGLHSLASIDQTLINDTCEVYNCETLKDEIFGPESEEIAAQLLASGDTEMHQFASYLKENCEEHESRE